MNAANEQLEHMSGVAGAISRAAGPALQAESRRFIAEHGLVRIGTAAWTGAGALPYKGVVHTVGPIWQGGYAHEDVRLIEAVTSALELAEKMKVRL